MTKGSRLKRFEKALNRDKYLYMIIALPVVYYILFHYVPLYGILISFFDVKVFRGLREFLGAPYVGLKYFAEYITDPYFWKLVRNTVIIRLYSIIFSFPIPILFALILNDVRNVAFKKFVQTVTYLPHFISTVVICGMLKSYFASDGIFNMLRVALGGEPKPFLSLPQYFRTIYIGSGIWQSFGWNSIVYLAALTGINPELYEAATLDGAGRLQKMWHVSLPGIKSTIVLLFIMQVGQIMNVGYEKILLLYNGSTQEVADVISTYVYRRGIIDSRFNYGTAVGLFTSVIGFAFLTASNAISRALSETSLW